MRDIRPVPMAATVIRLLGEFLPNTVDGTIEGNPLKTIDVATVPFTDFVMNLRRDIELSFLFFMTMGFGSCNSMQQLAFVAQ